VLDNAAHLRVVISDLKGTCGDRENIAHVEPWRLRRATPDRSRAREVMAETPRQLPDLPRFVHLAEHRSGGHRTRREPEGRVKAKTCEKAVLLGVNQVT
jgi:hypothetical protein